MRQIPLDIGVIHFVGIGGIGMSGIAEVMHNLGYQVQGSDQSINPTARRLQGLGVKVFEGHAAENIENAQVVVYSSAVKGDNPEIRAARAKLLPVVRRAEMLAELMRLRWAVAIGGTHGKTTTTTMIATMLETAGVDPTVINGGIINAYGTNARLGAGEWMVVEADESDGTFIKLPATIAVVTNIDPEHLDFYGTFDAARDAYRAFVQNIPFYGFAALCIDHPEVQALIGRVADRRILTYGFTPQADVRATNLRFAEGDSRFDVALSDRVHGTERELTDLRLPMPGKHNVQNALAAVLVAREMGFDAATIRRGLAAFKGVKRRFTKTGEADGVVVIDDYGHHPVEIQAVLAAARQAYSGRIVAVVQPHRYTRLRDLFEGFCTCFNLADTVIVADVYPAGEAPIEGINRDALVEGLQARGHRHVEALPSAEALPEMVNGMVQPGDLVVCLGAGSITNWAHALPEQLAKQRRPAGKGGRA